MTEIERLAAAMDDPDLRASDLSHLCRQLESGLWTSKWYSAGIYHHSLTHFEDDEERVHSIWRKRQSDGASTKRACCGEMGS